MTPRTGGAPGPPVELERLIDRVVAAARATLGEASAALPRAPVPVARKGDGSLLTALDLALHEALRTALAKGWPELPFLGEESTERERASVAAAPPFWCVDPLDGTTNFVTGFPFYALSVARVTPRGPDLGVVYDPVRGEAFGAARGRGAWLGGHRLEARAPGTLEEAVALVDTKRLGSGVATALASDPPFRSQRNLGAAALEWAWLAAGRAQLLVHGAHHPWDHTAGRLLLSEAGGAFHLKAPTARPPRASSTSGMGAEGAPPATEVVSGTDGAVPGPRDRVLPWLGPTGLAPAEVRAAGSRALLDQWVAWLDRVDADGAPSPPGPA